MFCLDTADNSADDSEETKISTELQGLFLDMLIQCIENLRENVEVIFIRFSNPVFSQSPSQP